MLTPSQRNSDLAGHYFSTLSHSLPFRVSMLLHFVRFKYRKLFVKVKREWFVNCVMPVWTWHGNHQLWRFFFIMWWVFLNSPSGTWTLEPASASWPLSGRGVSRTRALHWCRKLQFACPFDLWAVMIKLRTRTLCMWINIRIHCISS